MPDVHHNSGFTDYVNLNKDSTHPNPWKPPSRFDSFANYHSAAYKIYRPAWENDIFKTNVLSNPIAAGPLEERLGIYAYRGFLIGTTITYFDLAFVQNIPPQHITKNFARWLYITPPYVAMPVAFVATREILGGQFGHDKAWPYMVAPAAPAAIYGMFRNSSTSGLFAFGLFAAFSFYCKMQEDMGGMGNAGKTDDMVARSSQTWKDRWISQFYKDVDPGSMFSKWTDGK